MPWLTLLKSVPWSLILIAVLFFIGGWRIGHMPVPQLKDDLAAERACAPETACSERLQAIAAEREKQALINAKVSADVVNDYESEIAALRNKPARVVRVSVPTNNCPVRVPDAASRVDGRTENGLHGSTGRDIGPELYALVRECNEEAVKLKHLQLWTNAIGTSEN